MDKAIRTERLPNGNLRIVIPLELRETAMGRRLRIEGDEPEESEGAGRPASTTDRSEVRAKSRRRSGGT